MMNAPLQRYLMRLRESIARKGLVGALQQVAASILWRMDPAQIAVRAVMRENERFDAKHGTRTRGEIPLEQIGMARSEAAMGNGVYRAISTSHFEAALRLLKVRFEEYVFVDYGSGAGKALMLASVHPFLRIVGIEYSAVLHQTALANLEHYARSVPGGARVEAVLGDARDFQPPNAPLVCFFFNPFDASVWKAVLAQLEHHHRTHRLPIHILYVNIRDIAELGDVFSGFPVFTSTVKTRKVHILSTISTERSLEP